MVEALGEDTQGSEQGNKSFNEILSVIEEGESEEEEAVVKKKRKEKKWKVGPAENDSNGEVSPVVT